MKKKLFLILPALMFGRVSMAQQVGETTVSDPVKMGWMQGFPPSADKTLSAMDGSFFRFPALRYSVCHMREFMPTVVVSASPRRQEYIWKEQPDAGIDDITFTPTGQQKTMTWKQSLRANYTDGIIVLHRGRIVYEAYDGALSRDGVHAAMSVSKTFTGTLGIMLVKEGVLDEHRKAADYVPELRGSAFGDATVRQILDMTTGLKYSENYADPKAEVWAFSAAGNPFGKPSGYKGPRNYYEYLMTVGQEGRHGEVFGYKTINTDALAWIISRVTGKGIAQLLSERIWQPLGTHHDGYYQIDGSGIAFAGGGFSCNLRDAAMFGEMIRCRGSFNGRQILAPTVVADIIGGGDKRAFAKSGYTSLKGWSYRDMWWVTHNEHGAFTARGVHGQTIYIDPKAEMVIVRFASHPTAANAANDPTSLPAYHALAKYLINKDKASTRLRPIRR